MLLRDSIHHADLCYIRKLLSAIKQLYKDVISLEDSWIGGKG